MLTPHSQSSNGAPAGGPVLNIKQGHQSSTLLRGQFWFWTGGCGVGRFSQFLISVDGRGVTMVTGVIKRTVMKSSDVDTQEASKPPKVNENPDVRKVLGRPFQGPPRREEIQNLQMKAEFNKAHLTCARCGAAPSLEPRETRV